MFRITKIASENNLKVSYKKSIRICDLKKRVLKVFPFGIFKKYFQSIKASIKCKKFLKSQQFGNFFSFSSPKE